MEKVDFEREIKERHIKWDLNIDKMALIVIDMQNGFCREDGALEIPETREIVPNINRLAMICREFSIPVIWVYHTNRADGSDAGLFKRFWPIVFESKNGCREGTPGAELYKDLNIEEKDYTVRKCRYSAFIQGSSDIERLLRSIGKDTLIFTGVATNVCVGSSAWDAAMLDFNVIMVEDACATYSKAAQQSFLELARLIFSWVIPTNEIIKEIKQQRLK